MTGELTLVAPTNVNNRGRDKRMEVIVSPPALQCYSSVAAVVPGDPLDIRYNDTVLGNSSQEPASGTKFSDEGLVLGISSDKSVVGGWIR
jgi:hypothetical protein